MNHTGRRSRVFIVDDHPVCRTGLRTVFEQAGDLEVCGEAEDSPSALSALRKIPVDLVTIDVVLKGPSGLELLKQLKAEQPQLRALLMSMHDELLFAERALRGGAIGYVRKDAPNDEVLAAVRRALQGQAVFSEDFTSSLLTRMAGHARALPPAASARGSEVQDAALASLSDREVEILHLLGTGLSTRACAERLHLSVKTIEAHQANLKLKLGLSDVNQLRRYAAIWAGQGR